MLGTVEGKADSSLLLAAKGQLKWGLRRRGYVANAVILLCGIFTAASSALLTAALARVSCDFVVRVLLWSVRSVAIVGRFTGVQLREYSIGELCRNVKHWLTAFLPTHMLKRRQVLYHITACSYMHA